MAPQLRFGRVIRAKTEKTIMVRIGTLVKNHKYRVTYTRFKNIMTHDPYETARVGDWVRIRHSMPFSKMKRHILDAIVRPVPRNVPEPPKESATITMPFPRTRDQYLNMVKEINESMELARLRDAKHKAEKREKQRKFQELYGIGWVKSQLEGGARPEGPAPKTGALDLDAQVARMNAFESLAKWKKDNPGVAVPDGLKQSTRVRPRTKFRRRSKRERDQDLRKRG